MELNLFGGVWQVSLQQRVVEQASKALQNELKILCSKNHKQLSLMFCPKYYYCSSQKASRQISINGRHKIKALPWSSATDRLNLPGNKTKQSEIIKILNIKGQTIFSRNTKIAFACNALEDSPDTLPLSHPPHDNHPFLLTTSH